jgi:Lrp/AsnC family transcriptional regulator, regulator for asnA, asnC and gidA
MQDHGQVKTDAIDAKILMALLKESRTSFTQIAEDCKISINAIRKRYDRLCKTGVINGEIIQVNPAALGYNCVVNIGIITNLVDEIKFIKYLHDKPYVCAVFRNLLERQNLGCIIVLHDMQELSGILQDIETNLMVKPVNPVFWNRTSYLDYPENLVLTPSIGKIQNDPKEKLKVPNVKVEIDETDRKIAKMLTQKSRTTFTDIAKELNISTKNVIQRYNKLKGTVLTNSTITISLKKLGFNAIVNLQIKLANRNQTSEIKAKILKIPNVLVILEFVGGNIDLFPVIALRNYDELFRLKEQLTKIEGIEQISMLLDEPYKAWPLNIFSSRL